MFSLEIYFYRLLALFVVESQLCIDAIAAISSVWCENHMITIVLFDRVSIIALKEVSSFCVWLNRFIRHKWTRAKCAFIQTTGVEVNATQYWIYQ